jgi:hypothetical protein
MKEKLAALARFWQRSRFSLIIAGVLVIVIIFVGLHDLGMVLGYVATIIVMLDLTRRWRKPLNFIILAVASFFVLVFLAFLHEVVVIPLVTYLLGEGALSSPGLRIFSDTVSLIMLFICPMGVFIGFFGALISGVFHLVTLLRRRKTEAKT